MQTGMNSENGENRVEELNSCLNLQDFPLSTLSNMKESRQWLKPPAFPEEEILKVSV